MLRRKSDKKRKKHEKLWSENVCAAWFEVFSRLDPAFLAKHKTNVLKIWIHSNEVEVWGSS
jgi:hypothetical protein